MSQLASQQIETMPAGRELDALVAERVMGLEKHGGLNAAGTSTSEVWMKDGKQISFAEPPTYSTDIAEAWEVVEKIHDLQPRFILEAQPFVRPRVWWCSVYGHDLVEAPTAPLAICRAAPVMVHR